MTNSERLPHNLLMSQLKDRHNKIAELINKKPVHLIDVPLHGNIGDILIFLGTMQFLKEKNLQCNIMATYSNYSPKWASEDSVVLFQGGGNLGDLYNQPQSARESLIGQLHKSRVIILPQSIHFKNEINFEKCKKIFSSHPDLHIFTRDQNSYQIARDLTPNVYMAPDLAHQLWPIKRTTPPQSSTLSLIRSDNESLKTNNTISGNTVTDWPNLVGSLRSSLFDNLLRVLKVQNLLKLDKLLINNEMKLWNAYANRLANEAVNLFSRHEYVYTDRLHGHILACLLGIPNTVSDNSYGKNHSYANAWTSKSQIVNLVSN